MEWLNLETWKHRLRGRAIDNRHEEKDDLHNASTRKERRKSAAVNLRRSPRLAEKKGSPTSSAGERDEHHTAGSCEDDSSGVAYTTSVSPEASVNEIELKRVRSKTSSKSLKPKKSKATLSSAHHDVSRIPRAVIIKPRKKTLVLDLDETLIHSTARGTRGHDFAVEVQIGWRSCLYYVYKRPYCDEFLRVVSQWYTLIIFTASMSEYADPVIDFLDPTRKLIHSRYFRETCRLKYGVYIKDLTVICDEENNREKQKAIKSKHHIHGVSNTSDGSELTLGEVALVDNSPISYAENRDNGIPIESWISDPKDEALLDLLPMLDALRFVDDVRHVLSMKG
ncbi:NLI interacting factor-like phosphatase-domain-containing protein [Gaertneriomyces semiglobifer]|nr:NLI interacting factor-like phosphatase-domain-containing protein [Gaertneriomyces semiglobifer]